MTWLRENGFPVGVESYGRVSKLLEALPEGTEAAELRTLLAPLFARSPKDQQRFYRLFDRYWAQFAVEKAETREVEVKPRKDRTWMQKVRHRLNHRWIFILLTLLVSALILYIPIKVFFALKGTAEQPPANEYLTRYRLDEENYWQNLGWYLYRDLVGREQPCDSLEIITFGYQTQEIGEGKKLLVLTPFPQDNSNTWTYNWYRGDSLWSDEQSPQIVVPDTGSFPVSLQITTSYGCIADFSRLVELSGTLKCEAGFKALPVQGEPRTRLFRDSSRLSEGDEVRDWEWTWGGEVIGNESEFNYTFPEDQEEFDICLKIKTVSGCEAEICEKVRIAENLELEAPAALPLGPMPTPQLTPLDSTPLGPYYPLFVTIIVLVGMVSYDLYKRNRSQLFRNRKSPTQGPFTWQVRLPEPPQLYKTEVLHRLAVQLRRRQESEIQLLDLPGTIDATLESGGITQLRYRPGSRPAEYLFLIERKHQRDHFATWAARLAEVVGNQDVFIEAYFYRADFENLEHTQTGKIMDLGTLQARFPQHRLVVFGNGEGLTDAIRGTLNARAFQLLFWKERALLTPSSPAEWSLREVALARHMIVVPAEARVLTQLPEWWELGQWPPLSEWTQQRFWDSPPELGEFADLDELEVYLGPERMDWVALCSIFPELHHDLTWEMAQVAGIPLTEPNILKVFELKWFREGGIPDTMRMKLMERLSEEKIGKGREALVALLGQQKMPAGTLVEDRWQIQLTSQKWALKESRWWKQRGLNDKMQEYLERDQVEDPAIWELVNQNRGGMVSLNIPEMLRNGFFRKGIPLLGWRSGVKYSLFFLLLLILLFPFYRDRFKSLTETPSLQEWINQRRSLVEIEGVYYRLQGRADSARYFSYVGVKHYKEGRFGPAYNEFDLAMKLQPFEPLYNYQRGLAGQKLLAIQYEDSLAKLCQQDMARALALCLSDQSQLSASTGFYLRENRLQLATQGPQGKNILISTGSLVRHYYTPEGNATRTFELPGLATALALAPDKGLALIAVGDVVYFFDLSTGKSLQQIKAHERTIRGLSVSPDQSKMVSAGEDHLAITWDLDLRQVRDTLEFIHTGAVLDARFSPDGSKIVTASDDSTVVIWDSEEGLYEDDFFVGDQVYQATFLGDASLILSANLSGQLSLIDLRNRRMVARGESTWAEVLGLSVNQDGTMQGLTYSRVEEEAVRFSVWQGAAYTPLKDITLQNLLPIPPDDSYPGYRTGSLRSAQVSRLEVSADGMYALAVQPGQGVEQLRLGVAPWHSIYLEAWYGKGIAAYLRRDWREAEYRFERLTEVELSPAWQARGYFSLGVVDLYFSKEAADSTEKLGYFIDGIQSLGQAVRLDSSLRPQLRSLATLLLDGYQAIDGDREVREMVCNLVAEYREGACSLFDYEEVLSYQQGLAAVQLNGQWGYIDSMQRLAIPIQFVSAESFKSGGLARVQTDGEDGKVHSVLINRDGEVVYDSLLASEEGRVGVREVRSQSWGFLAISDYSVVVPAEYDEVWPYFLGYAKVRKDYQYGLIDHTGELTLDGVSYREITFKAEQGMIVELKPSTRGATLRYSYPIELTQTMRTGTSDEISQSDENEGDATMVRVLGVPRNGLALAVKSGLYGYIGPASKGSPNNIETTDGLREMVIDFQYEEAYEFSYDRAAVRRPGEAWGYLDPLGRVVIPTRYDSAGHFQQFEKQVLARVKRDGLSFYIDRTGSCVPYAGLNCPGSQELEEGPAPVPNAPYPRNKGEAELDPNAVIPFEANGKWGLKRGDGTVLLSPRFDQPFSFEGEYARVLQNGLWGYINQQGRIIVSPIYEQVQHFSDGLAAVKLPGGLWGYIDESGQVKIDFNYEDARPFTNGRTIVRIGKLSFRIDRNGNRIGARKY